MSSLTPSAELKASRRKPAGTAWLCALALFFLGPGAASGANLEDKMKYERALEQKVEEVLADLLGPGKSRVMIRAAVDFSSSESVENIVLESSVDKAEPFFKWQDINKQASSDELLPGFPADSKKDAPPTTKSGSGKYRREVGFPQALVRRLTVSLVLDEGLSAAVAQKARRVVSDLLALDPGRGDDILLLRARFTPVWYTYEMLLTLVKFGIIAVLTVFSMGVLLIGFLKIASAMRSRPAPEPVNTPVEAAVPGGRGAPLGLPAPADSVPPREEPPDGMIFKVTADKLEILVRMLAKDEPADIALIAVHLPAALRGRFISMLPPETASEVLANIVKVRFVEPEMLARIKEGLEARLNGSVGGYEKAVELIERTGLRSREALLGVMQRKYPEIAARVRTRILLPGDLENLEEKDFGILAGAVPVELWAAASRRLTKGTRSRLKGHLTERAWKILEQTLAYGTPAEEKIDAALEKVLSTAWKLIGDGRIKKPGAEASAIGFDPAVTAPGT